MPRAATTARLPHLGRPHIAVLALLLAASSPARADPRPDPRRATELYNESLQHYREGRFKEAANLLRELYRETPEPVLLYNLGRACEGLGDLDCAIASYTRYLSEEPDVGDRGAIEQRVRTLHEELDEKRAVERQREAARAAKPRPADAKATPPDGSSPSPVPWVIAGVGAFGVATGLFVGVLAQSQHGDATNDPVQQSGAAKQARAEDFATAANIAFVTGGLIAVAGVAWGVWDISHSRARTASSKLSVDLRIGPTGALFSTRF
jgi:tetratricopeptide (TPR) repeat protein